MTSSDKILEQVKHTIPTFMPKGAEVSLFGSRARGDASKDSDWDFLLILDKPKVDENVARVHRFTTMLNDYIAL